MYMAFVICDDDEDLVSFYVRKNNGDYYIYNEYIPRGDVSTLNHYIQYYMFEKREKSKTNDDEVGM